MADDVTEFHKPSEDGVLFVIADPDRDDAWLAAPDAETVWLDSFR